MTTILFAQPFPAHNIVHPLLMFSLLFLFHFLPFYWPDSPQPSGCLVYDDNPLCSTIPCSQHYIHSSCFLFCFFFTFLHSIGRIPLSLVAVWFMTTILFAQPFPAHNTVHPLLLFSLLFLFNFLPFYWPDSPQPSGSLVNDNNPLCSTIPCSQHCTSTPHVFSFVSFSLSSILLAGFPSA